MTEEQEQVVIQSIREAMACGLDTWWEACVNSNRVVPRALPYADTPAAEQALIEAWYTLFMESVAGISQEDQKDFTIGEFFDMISTKWKVRYDEAQAVKRLIQSCKDEGSFTAEVVQCQKYGY